MYIDPFREKHSLHLVALLNQPMSPLLASRSGIWKQSVRRFWVMLTAPTWRPLRKPTGSRSSWHTRGFVRTHTICCASRTNLKKKKHSLFNLAELTLPEAEEESLEGQPNF